MTLEWVACSALTGEVLAEVPELAVDEVATVIGSYSTTAATLPLVDDSDTSEGPAPVEVIRNNFPNPEFVYAPTATVPEDATDAGFLLIGA